MSEEPLDLHALRWSSLPNSPYIMKCRIDYLGYHIMVSNLTYLYSEKLEGLDIVKKFSKLNPFAQMKLPVILENLKRSLEKILSGKSEVNMAVSSDKLISMSVEFSSGPVLCKYNFEMDLLSAEQFTENVITPVIFNGLLNQRQILALQRRITDYENKGPSLTSTDTSVSSGDLVNPDWLKGKNVSTDNLLHAFLKIQKCSEDLISENSDHYNALKKEKSRDDVQSTSTNKKMKVESLDDESSIKFEDNDEKLTTEKEAAACTDKLSSQMKSSAKKKKLFKM